MSAVHVTMEVDGKTSETEGDAALVIVLKDQGEGAVATISLHTSVALAPVLLEAIEQEAKDLKEKILLHLAAVTFASRASTSLN